MLFVKPLIFKFTQEKPHHDEVEKRVQKKGYEQFEDEEEELYSPDGKRRGMTLADQKEPALDGNHPQREGNTDVKVDLN